MTELPERMLQFGRGDLLPGLVNLLVHEANTAGENFGRIVSVRSGETKRTGRAWSEDARYPVRIRGLESGRLVDATVEITSVARALQAQPDWEEVVDVACTPELKFLVTDTAPDERELLAEDDDRSGNSPRSFPAQLTELLNVRHELGLPGLTMLPCEPVANNADALLALALAQAARWGWEGRFTYWLETECRWLNTLADRIIVPPVADDEDTEVEPFALWVIEGSREGPRVFSHPSIGRSLHLSRYRLRKERLFDDVEFALARYALPLGFSTLHEAVTDPTVDAWLRDLLFNEILPSLEGLIDNGEAYARHTLERLANPLLIRRLSDLNSAAF